MNTVDIIQEDETVENGGARFKVLTLLYILLVVVGATLVGIFLYTAQKADHDAKYQAIASSQRILSLQVSKHALQAVGGNEKAFQQLKKTKSDFTNNLKLLTVGVPGIELPPSPESVVPTLNETKQVWSVYEANADFIYDRKDSILGLDTRLTEVARLLPQLQKLATDIAYGISLDATAPIYLVRKVEGLNLRFFRISTSIREILKGAQASALAADQYYRDITEITKILQTLQKGEKKGQFHGVKDKALKVKLNEARILYLAMSGEVAAVLETSSAVFESIEKSEEMAANDVALDKSTAALSEAYLKLKDTRLINEYVGYGMAYLFFFIIAAIYFFVQKEQKQRIKETEQQRAIADERRQSAIEKSSEDELAIQGIMVATQKMASGDMTAAPETDESITGGLADALEMMSENISNNLHSVIKFANQVVHAANTTAETSERMAKGGERQAEKINSAELSLSTLIKSFETTADNTDKLLQQSRSSAQSVHKGVETLQVIQDESANVKRSIQDTSKRVKRLGENSQEIAKVVKVIEDVADLTEVLAVNAELEASRAGEHGRGFVVVAEQVRQLAVSSKAKTIEIANLVNTIQADTQEAIQSMETTTEGVVRGSQMTDQAGQLFTVIADYAVSVERLVEDISAEINSNTESAVAAGELMSEIRDETAESSAATTQTAQSISNLANTAESMTESLSDFKLIQSMG